MTLWHDSDIALWHDGMTWQCVDLISIAEEMTWHDSGMSIWQDCAAWQCVGTIAVTVGRDVTKCSHSKCLGVTFVSTCPHGDSVTCHVVLRSTLTMWQCFRIVFTYSQGDKQEESDSQSACWISPCLLQSTASGPWRSCDSRRTFCKNMRQCLFVGCLTSQLVYLRDGSA